LRLCENSGRVGEFLAKAQRRKVRKEPCRKSEPYLSACLEIVLNLNIQMQAAVGHARYRSRY